MKKIYVLTGEQSWFGHGESGTTITIQTVDAWSKALLPAFASKELAQEFILRNEQYKYSTISELELYETTQSNT